jgi:malonyl CoA-acyl carrier protein transacylase
MRSSMPDDDAKAVDAVMAVYELGGENARQDVAEFLARQSSGTAGSSAVVRALVITGTAEAAETLRLACRRDNGATLRNIVFQAARRSQSPDMQRLAGELVP